MGQTTLRQTGIRLASVLEIVAGMHVTIASLLLSVDFVLHVLLKVFFVDDSRLGLTVRLINGVSVCQDIIDMPRTRDVS